MKTQKPFQIKMADGSIYELSRESMMGIAKRKGIAWILESSSEIHPADIESIFEGTNWNQIKNKAKLVKKGSISNLYDSAEITN